MKQARMASFGLILGSLACTMMFVSGVSMADVTNNNVITVTLNLNSTSPLVVTGMQDTLDWQSKHFKSSMNFGVNPELYAYDWMQAYFMGVEESVQAMNSQIDSELTIEGVSPVGLQALEQFPSKIRQLQISEDAQVAQVKPYFSDAFYQKVVNYDNSFIESASKKQQLVSMSAKERTEFINEVTQSQNEINQLSQFIIKVKDPANNQLITINFSSGVTEQSLVAPVSSSEKGSTVPPLTSGALPGKKDPFNPLTDPWNYLCSLIGLTVTQRIGRKKLQDELKEDLHDLEKDELHSAQQYGINALHNMNVNRLATSSKTLSGLGEATEVVAKGAGKLVGVFAYVPIVKDTYKGIQMIRAGNTSEGAQELSHAGVRAGIMVASNLASAAIVGSLVPETGGLSLVLEPVVNAGISSALNLGANLLGI